MIDVLEPSNLRAPLGTTTFPMMVIMSCLPANHSVLWESTLCVGGHLLPDLHEPSPTYSFHCSVRSFQTYHEPQARAFFQSSSHLTSKPSSMAPESNSIGACWHSETGVQRRPTSRPSEKACIRTCWLCLFSHVTSMGIQLVMSGHNIHVFRWMALCVMIVFSFLIRLLRAISPVLRGLATHLTTHL